MAKNALSKMGLLYRGRQKSSKEMKARKYKLERQGHGVLKVDEINRLEIAALMYKFYNNRFLSNCQNYSLLTVKCIHIILHMQMTVICQVGIQSWQGQFSISFQAKNWNEIVNLCFNSKKNSKKINYSLMMILGVAAVVAGDLSYLHFFLYYFYMTCYCVK